MEEALCPRVLESAPSSCAGGAALSVLLLAGSTELRQGARGSAFRATRDDSFHCDDPSPSRQNVDAHSRPSSTILVALQANHIRITKPTTPFDDLIRSSWYARMRWHCT